MFEMLALFALVAALALATMPSEAPAAGAPDPGSAVSPAAPDAGSGPAPVAAPSGGVTADEFADLASQLEGDPRKDAFLGRLRELAGRRDEFKSQLSQYEAFTPYQDLVTALAENQIAPHEVIARLTGQPTAPQAPQAPQDPNQPFYDWLKAQGVDANELSYDPDRWGLYQDRFALHQGLQQLREQQEAAQMQQAQAELEKTMGQIAQQYPVFQEVPEFQQALYALGFVAAEHGIGLSQVAQQFHTALKAYEAKVLGSYAAGKAQDGAGPPPVTGGAAPAPTSQPNWHTMTPQQRQEVFESYYRAAGSQV